MGLSSIFSKKLTLSGEVNNQTFKNKEITVNANTSLTNCNFQKCTIHYESNYTEHNCTYDNKCKKTLPILANPTAEQPKPKDNQSQLSNGTAEQPKPKTPTDNLEEMLKNTINKSNSHHNHKLSNPSQDTVDLENSLSFLGDGIKLNEDLNVFLHTNGEFNLHDGVFYYTSDRFMDDRALFIDHKDGNSKWLTRTDLMHERLIGGMKFRYLPDAYSCSKRPEYLKYLENSPSLKQAYNSIHGVHSGSFDYLLQSTERRAKNVRPFGR